MPTHALARWTVPALLTVIACGGKPAPTPDAAAAAPAPDTAKTSRPAPDAAAAPRPAPDAAAAPHAARDTTGTTEARADGPNAPTVAADAGGDWLLWFARGDVITTRWLRLTGDAFEPIAERKALVVSDGERLWRVERRDTEVPVKGCECLDTDDEGACDAYATLAQPGIVAFDLADGAATTVRKAEADVVMGGDISQSARPVGGVGARLYYTWRDDGYYCGAHGSYEGGTVAFDLARGEAARVLPVVHEALPRSVREPAAAQILPLLKDCDGDPAWTTADADEQMALEGFRVALVDGKPRVTWDFSAWVMYACSADYAAHGSVTTGLIPAGAAAGLDAVPTGLARAMAAIGDADVVGWSRLTLSGAARDAALARFAAAPEARWPMADAHEVLRPEAQARQDAKARDLLAEGRKRTRAGAYADAVASFNQALGLAPKLAPARSGRGYAYMLDGRLDEAKADFEAALELSDAPKFQAAVWYNLGLLAEKRGDKAAAKAAYERSLTLRPSPAVRKALGRL